MHPNQSGSSFVSSGIPPQTTQQTNPQKQPLQQQQQPPYVHNYHSTPPLQQQLNPPLPIPPQIHGNLGSVHYAAGNMQRSPPVNQSPHPQMYQQQPSQMYQQQPSQSYSSSINQQFPQPPISNQPHRPPQQISNTSPMQTNYPQMAQIPSSQGIPQFHSQPGASQFQNIPPSFPMNPSSQQFPQTSQFPPNPSQQFPSSQPFPRNPSQSQISHPRPSYDQNPPGLYHDPSNTTGTRMSTASKIPTEQIPNPIDVRNADQETFNSMAPYRTSLENPPPLSTTKVQIIDDGNCHPSFMRLTTFKTPSSKDMAEQSGIPLGLVVQPFAPVSFPIPLIDCSSGSNLERCKNCMAYINPFVIFGTGGRKYKCNICMQDNDIKGENLLDSYSNVGSGGPNVGYRPELKYGTVEFIVPPEYVHRPPSQTAPFLLFAIDVSKNELIPLFISAIKRCINYLSSESCAYSHVALVGYERNTHFIDFSIPGNPSICTSADLEADYSPLSKEQYMISPREKIQEFIEVLDRFQSLFKPYTRTDCSLWSTLKFILNGTKERNGKIILFNATHFGTGPGSLTLRDEVCTVADKEKSYFGALSSELKEIGIAAGNNGVSIDLFAISTNNFLDLASTSIVSSLSGGELYYYAASGIGKGEAIGEDLLRCIGEARGFDCYAKLRASNGLSITDTFGNLYMRTSTELLFGALGDSKTFCIHLNVEEKLSERTKVSFQFATLYTDTRGMRRVRVHNLCVGVASSMSDLFLHANAEATSNFLCKRAISLVTSDSLSTIRDLISLRIASILLAYRKHCSPNTADSQLVLPDSLKLLPLYMLALQKTRAFSPVAIKSDLRIYWIRLLNSLSLSSLAYLCYPRMYCCTNGSLNRDQMDGDRFPTPLMLTHEILDPTHIYCVSNGVIVIVFIGKSLEAQYLQDLFGVPALAAVDPVSISLSQSLPVLDTEISKTTRLLIRKLQDNSEYNVRSLPLFIVRQGIDPMEGEFSSMLVNDQSGGLPSYVDYLCSLHSAVKSQLKK